MWVAALFFCVGLCVGYFIPIGLVGWSNFRLLTFKKISTGERDNFTRALNDIRIDLLKTQQTTGSLPKMTSDEFQQTYIPSVSGGSNPVLRVEYANDATIHLSATDPERALVVLKIESRNGQAIHILTSQSHVIQSGEFDPIMWDTIVAGRPISFDNMRLLVWTDLNK
jgi:hypothetical protein